MITVPWRLLSTAAAPTYFPTCKAGSGIPLIDGGVWANNPVAIGAIEAIGILGWQPSDLHLLSLGCTTAPLHIRWEHKYSTGKFGWALKLADLFLTAQSTSAVGMTQHLLPNRDQLVRISHTVSKNRFDLDRIREIPSLRGMGEAEARKALPQLRATFFSERVADDFIPFRGFARPQSKISEPT